jgi:tetratricopeptide (TPR) repeat protein
VDEIRQAKDEADHEVNEGTFRGTMAKTALQGRLEREFEDGLDTAWASAAKANQIDNNISFVTEGYEITPASICGGVCGLRGDLRFALDKWDEAINFYQQALQYNPSNAGFQYNLAATYTNKHEPALAIQAFEKVIQMDPSGDFAVEATKNIHRLQTGKVGKKSFTGSLKVVAILGGLALLSLLVMGQNAGTGFFGLVFWGGILALYCWLKYK